MNTPTSSATEQLTKLTTFRQAVYDRLGPGRDALWNVLDAILTAAHPPSFAHLSQEPVFTRQWPSLYKALDRACLPANGFLDLYARRLPADDLVVLAGDHTAHPRPKAVTVPERTIEHQPMPLPSQTPITVGYGYSTVAVIPEEDGSWALPLLHERITPDSSPLATMLDQLGRVRQHVDAPLLLLLDAEYPSADFLENVVALGIDTIARMRGNRVLYQAPGPYGGRGRPRKHGPRFTLHDAATWPTPDQALHTTHARLGPVHVQMWAGLHLAKAPDVAVWLVRVERVDETGTPRPGRPWWLVRVGQPPPPLPTWWWRYGQRFNIDHWNRFSKQRQHWLLPKLGAVHRIDAWSALQPLVTWMLWLARAVVTEYRLPWQAPQPTNVRTPGRVAQSFSAHWAQVGTPATRPKPRGKAPGRATGFHPPPRPRLPIRKKRSTPQKKQTTKQHPVAA